MKANIPPFTVGQKVVCLVTLTGRFNTIKKNEIYTVNRVYFNNTIEGRGWVVVLNEKGHWFVFDEDTKQLLFAPVQEMKALLLTFEKIKEEEKEEILVMN